MTAEELAGLPLGSIVHIDDDERGEIIQAGVHCQIRWKECTSIIETEVKDWHSFICHLESDEAW